ncbi:primosomal protein N' [Maribacter sp. 2307ULW6-5]|uniref:replication restart helicase PriA n=1 Tax=Maribacter sp. 2307ULW6-5 TaxID=3386275 RepID=UPI0039BC8BBF
MSNFIDVILPIPLERLFTYAVTPEEAAHLLPGMRVAVPFGKSKIYTALVARVHTQPPTAYTAKEIHEILDDDVLVTATQMRHWQWIADYYMATLGEVMRSALPGAFLLESETFVVLNKDTTVQEGLLEDDEFLVFEALQHQPILKVREIAGILDKKNALPTLQRLLDKDVIRLKEEVYEQYKPKLVHYVRLAPHYADDAHLEPLLHSLSRAPKQSQAVLALFQLMGTGNKPIPLSDLEQAAHCTRAVVKSLVEKGILETYQLRHDRVSHEQQGGTQAAKVLNEVQQNALEDIRSHFAENKVSLLKGITSSGKTEVYVQLIQTVLDQGKQVLYLLPEIALTTQLIARLQRYFGDRIAVYHSKYNVQERVEVWNNVLAREEKAQLVIGARSSLLLPFADLGLIIVDEEHEASFKQFDPAPRYHARDAAIVLGKLHRANVLLGSATPSLESYHNAQKGKYGYTEINRRYANVPLPEMELVDIKEAHRKKRMKGHFSERLLQEMTDTLELGDQVILFQNRRGYAPILECTSCGNAPQCPNCDVSLTYHQYKKQLRCHYCGHHTAIPQGCHACGSVDLDTKGFGTEQIEQEVRALFPEAKVGRMDLDTTRGKHGYEKIITAFERRELDILVGTQMLTKGLDFRNVNLVGVMNADALLNFPDYRTHERSFQLLTQVAGRAGRTERRGRVIIQTYNPYHQILKQVSTGDYDTMYKEQLYQRRQYNYPPLVRIVKITFKHKNYHVLNEAADWFAGALRQHFGDRVLGPEYPPVARIRNQYLKHLLVKMDGRASVAGTKQYIAKVGKSFAAIAAYRSVRVIHNVDHI